MLLIAPARVHAQKPADTVALNGKIHTVNPEQPWAEAVAIRGTDIVYVGDNDGVEKFIGKNTTVADLQSVMPGIGLRTP